MATAIYVIRRRRTGMPLNKKSLWTFLETLWSLGHDQMFICYDVAVKWKIKATSLMYEQAVRLIYESKIEYIWRFF